MYKTTRLLKHGIDFAFYSAPVVRMSMAVMKTALMQFSLLFIRYVGSDTAHIALRSMAIHLHIELFLTLGAV